MADEDFYTRLRAAVEDGGPLCGGIDPSRETLAEWGLDDSLDALEFCAMTWLEALARVTRVIKPQVAFFERFASGGIAVLERLISEARAAGLVIIADAKRGDVGSTNEGYAQAWLDPTSPLGVDALTVHPYLGVDALAPLVDSAARAGRGLFVLAATSNPEGRAFQRAVLDDGRRIEAAVVASAGALNRRTPGTVGVVVGATIDAGVDLSGLDGPVLVPGVGAQGAGVDDVARRFAQAPENAVVVNVSRSIAAAGPKATALYDRACRWRDELAEAL